MAKVSTWSFSNSSASQHTIAPTALGLVANYAVVAEDANMCRLSNKTSPVDAEELITVRSKSIPQVNTDLVVHYPPKVRAGVQATITVEAIRTTTDTENPDFRVDEPFVLVLQMRSPKSASANNQTWSEMLSRGIGTLQKSDGTWRFDEIIRGAERPIVD